VCHGSTQRTGAIDSEKSNEARRMLDPMPYENVYPPAMPVSAYASAATRHMHQFDTTREQLAEVALSARKRAQRNPEALMRSLSIEGILKARRWRTRCRCGTAAW
jgi:acetyl-CoA acetyltransferase